MPKFQIDYNTGIVDEIRNASLLQAIETAIEYSAHTGENIDIYQVDTTPLERVRVAQLTWYTDEPDFDQDNPPVAIFGNEGYYLLRLYE